MTFTRAQQSNRKPKAKKPLKRKTPVKRQSAKGKAYQAEFEAMKRKMLPDTCKGWFDFSYLCNCDTVASTLHHLLPRSQGGDNSEANLLPVCDPCHKWIHANPKHATALGLLKSRYQGGKQ